MGGIVPVFDPASGASGGPAAGGGDGISPNPSGTPVNLNDGSWTLLDPLSIVQSVAYDSGTNTNTVTCNAAGATNDLVWSASAVAHTGPRWYRALEIGGVPMTTDDFVTAIYRFGPLRSSTTFRAGGYYGLAEDPSTTVTADILGAGAGWIYYAPAGNVQNGVWSNTAATFESSHADARYARSTSFYGKGEALFMTYQSFTDADALRWNGQRDANLTLTGSVPVYEIVALGTRTSVDAIVLNDEWAIQAWSTFLKQA